MPADEPSDEIASPRDENVWARFSPLQHDFAGYRLQFVRRIFPNVAAGSGHRDKSARKPYRPAEHDYGFHALSATRQPRNRFRILDQAGAASLEVGRCRLGRNFAGGFAGDETNHGRRAHDLWRRRETGIFTSPVARPRFVVGDDRAAPCRVRAGCLWAPDTELGNARAWPGPPVPRPLAVVLSAGGDVVVADGVNSDLSFRASARA